MLRKITMLLAAHYNNTDFDNIAVK